VRAFTPITIVTKVTAMMIQPWKKGSRMGGVFALSCFEATRLAPSYPLHNVA
jgi:hypothetical protein